VNVVVVLMDDLAWGDLACHGNPWVRTPRLDALHDESVRFTRYSSGPMCTPARASLMTGRYHQRTRAIDTFCGRSMIDPGETTLGHVLQRAGYRTGGFGKWHLGDAYPMRACDLGFDETLVHNAGGIGQPGDHPDNHRREGEAYFDPVLHRDGRPERHTGYCTDIFTDAAIDFVRRAVGDGSSFFCYLGTNAPHTPLEVADEWIEPYRELGVNEVHARLYGMVENIDWNVGRLLDALPPDTVVLYTSDHGPCPSARDAKGQQRWNAGLRGEKGSLFQGAIKVPCFWRVPGVARGRDDTRLSSPIDVLPTVAALTGAPLPEDVHLDGVDLLAPEDPDRALFLQWHRGDRPERYRAFAVLSDRWKLYEDALFDLDADPSEEHDVAGEHPELVRSLRAAYDTWFDDVTAAGFALPRIVIGSPRADPVLLTRQDWHIDGGDGDIGEIAGWLGTTRGWWDVHVEGDGTARYDVDVLLDPFAWSHPAFFRGVSLAVGDDVVTVPWVLQVTRYSFRDVALPAGDVRIEAWASARDRRESALYVEVTRRSTADAQGAHRSVL
jgi:arylsulfatase A-like enzyme